MKKWMWIGAGIFWTVILWLIADVGVLKKSVIGMFIAVAALLAGMLTALGFGGGPLAFPDNWFHGRLRGLGRIGTALVYTVSLFLVVLVLFTASLILGFRLGPYSWAIPFGFLYVGLPFYAAASVFTPKEVPRLDPWGRLPPILLVSSLLVIYSLPAVRAYIYRPQSVRTDPRIHETIKGTWFTPDSKWLVTAGLDIAGAEIKVWDLATKSLAQTIPWHEGEQILFSRV